VRKGGCRISRRIMVTLLAVASLFGLLKVTLVTVLAAANALLALLATVSVWKAYLALGMKVGLTLLVCIPIVGLLIYLVWGQRKVREAQ
jgi:hypothetical protein